jgi:hypothetical protein
MKSTNNKGAAMNTYTAVKWTKISAGRYRYNDTDYEAVKNDYVGGVGWFVLYRGKQASETIVTNFGCRVERPYPIYEPTREFAGYAIEALIAEESR